MTTSRRPLWKPVLVLAVVNFLSFVIVAEFLGGSALYGCPKDGHYFVCEHGWYTEVSRAVWIYSCCHAISVWVVFGLVPLSLIYGALTEWSDSDSEQEGEK